MTINYTFKIKPKYFDAILSFDKTFELRHKEVKPNSIVKLECEDGRTLTFLSGICESLKKNIDCYHRDFYCYDSWDKQHQLYFTYYFYSHIFQMKSFIDNNDTIEYLFDWYDKFCWDYINEKQTYIIEIKKY